MKVYLAALYSRRPEMEKHANYLASCGYEVVSRWVYGGEEGKTSQHIAEIDLEDVDKADVVLSFTEPHGTKTSGGGRHAEFGYALAKGKQVDLVGEREHVFHYSSKVHSYGDIFSWIASMRARADNKDEVAAATLCTGRLLPAGSAERKRFPMCTGLLDYFPDALAAVAEISYNGNQKHNPGEPTHWARGKSMDHPDCVVRHLVERGTFDAEGNRHSAQLAWRALAILQEELEFEKELSCPRGATPLPSR